MIENRTAVTGTVFTSMFFLGIVIAIIGAAARNIGLSTSQIGMLVAVQNVGFMFGVLVVSAIADSMEKTRIMLGGSILLMAAFAFFYAFDSFAVNVLIMLVMGAGIGVYEGTSDSVLLDIHDRSESLYINLNHMFVTIGSLVVTVYLVFLQMNWRNSMIQAAGAVLVLSIVFSLSHVDSKKQPRVSLRSRLLNLLRNPTFISCFIILFIAVGTQLTIMSITTTYFMQYRGHDQITSKIVAVLYLGGVGVGRIVIGYLTKKGRIYRTLSVLFPVNAAISFVYFRFDTGAAAYGLAVLLGLSLSGLLPLSVAIVGLRFRDVSGTAIGLMKLAIPIGGIVVPLLLSTVAKAVSLPKALMLMPLLFLLGAVLTISARRFLTTGTSGPGGHDK